MFCSNTIPTSTSRDISGFLSTVKHTAITASDIAQTSRLKFIFIKLNMQIMKTNEALANKAVESGLVVAVVGEGVHVAAQSALEHILGLDLHPFGTLAHLVPDLRAVIANVVLRLGLRQLLEQLLGPHKVLLHEYFRVIVRTFCALLAVPVHVVPA